MKKRKCTKRDFTEADLPATHGKMFFDCYREQFSLIIRIGLVCLLLFSPIIIVWLMRDAYLSGVLDSLKEQTAENIEAVYLTVNTVFGLIEFLAFTLFFTLFSGAAQIIRQLCWGEPVFFFDDFKKGIRENAAGFAIVGSVISLLRYLIGMMIGSAYYYLLVGIFSALFVPLGIWILLQKLYYSLRWRQVIKNAVLYLINTFPVTVLLLICTVLPFLLVISFVRLLILKYLLLLLLAVLYVVPMVMVWVLYACHTFDIWLNKKYHPEIYRKGLRPDTSVSKSDGEG